MVHRLIVVMSVFSIIIKEENKYQSENREGKANKKVLTQRLDRLLHKFSVFRNSKKIAASGKQVKNQFPLYSSQLNADRKFTVLYQFAILYQKLLATYYSLFTN